MPPCSCANKKSPKDCHRVMIPNPQMDFLIRAFFINVPVYIKKYLQQTYHDNSASMIRRLQTWPNARHSSVTSQSSMFYYETNLIQTPMFFLYQQVLLLELRTFIKGVHPRGHKLTSEEHARCAIRLLQTLPAARNAVLEHLCHVFDECVNLYLLEGEGESIIDVQCSFKTIEMCCDQAK